MVTRCIRSVRSLRFVCHRFAFTFELALIRAEQVDFRANQSERERGALSNSDERPISRSPDRFLPNGRSGSVQAGAGGQPSLRDAQFSDVVVAQPLGDVR